MYFVFCVFPGCYGFVVSTSAVNYLDRLVSKMTYYVEWDIKPYTLTHLAVRQTMSSLQIITPEKYKNVILKVLKIMTTLWQLTFLVG